MTLLYVREVPMFVRLCGRSLSHVLAVTLSAGLIAGGCSTDSSSASGFPPQDPNKDTQTEPEDDLGLGDADTPPPGEPIISLVGFAGLEFYPGLLCGNSQTES